MKKSPLALVKERFTDKAGLVKAVKDLASGEVWLDRLNEDKGLEHVSNAKLLHLHEVLTSVKKEYGSRAKLIDALLKSLKREKDAGYRARLEAQPTPRVYDAARVALKAEKAKGAPKKAPVAKKAEKAPAAPAKKAATRSSKAAPAKKAAAKRK